MDYERRTEAILGPSTATSDLVITVDEGTNTLIAMGPARLLGGFLAPWLRDLQS